MREEIQILYVVAGTLLKLFFKMIKKVEVGDRLESDESFTDFDKSREYLVRGMVRTSNYQRTSDKINKLVSSKVE
jgi:hypothetical protein